MQNFIKLQLKSPNTASFGGVFSDEFQDYDKCVKRGRKPVRRHWVGRSGTARTTVRTDFTVKLRYTGDESEHWQLVVHLFYSAVIDMSNEATINLGLTILKGNMRPPSEIVTSFDATVAIPRRCR